jgi:hypothetical protein
MLLETWLLTSVVQESKWIWAAAMDWEALEEGDENEVKVVAVRAGRYVRHLQYQGLASYAQRLI